MPWLIFVLAARMLWAMSAHIDKYLIDRCFRRGSVAVLLVFTAVTSLLLALAIWLPRPDTFALPLSSAVLIVGSGALLMGAMYFYLEALQTEEASAVAPWFQAAPLFGDALGYVLAWRSHPGGVDSASWQRFRTGKLPAARVLDLHGQTAQRAFHALVTFLRTAHADRLRCVEIVTGRGSASGVGVLRRELPLWLNLPDIRPLVLAATHPHAANPGSVRLLLRRVR